MALATYSDLKTSIANWLHRDDLTAIIPDFIVLCESRLNRLLNLNKMEAETTLTMTPASRYVPYPADMSSPIALWVETYKPRQRINYVPPTELPVASNISAIPQYFTIDGSNLAFDMLADQAHVLTFRYNQQLSLSDVVTTNAILQEYPDLYLYGSLLEAAPFIKDTEIVGLWQAKFSNALQEVNDNEGRTQALSMLATEIKPRGSRFNINRGY